MQFKRALSCLIAIMLIFHILASPHVTARTLHEMQKEKELLEQKKSVLTDDIEQKDAELESNTSTIATTVEQLQKLDIQVTNTHYTIHQIEFAIAQTTEEIDGLQSAILTLENIIKERDIIVRERLQALQAKDSSVDFFDVLLRSKSFSDFIGRFSSVKILLEADRKIMTQQASDIEQLEEQKLLVSQKLTTQEVNKEELQDLLASLDVQKNEKNRLVIQLAIEQKKLASEKTVLESAYDQTEEMTQELQQAMVDLQKRQTVFQQQSITYLPSSDPVAATCSEGGQLDEQLFLAQFTSAGAFTGKGQSFITIAREFQIDPVLMASIAFLETGSGTSNAVVGYNNPGGLMNPATNWSTLLKFDSIEDGLRSMAKTMNRLIHKGGLTSISDLGSAYAPIGAENDPRGLNQHWVPGVKKFSMEFGGLTQNCRAQ